MYLFQFTASAAAISKIGGAPEVDLETLKRRAERFGQTNSGALKKAELAEKLKARQERFGASGSGEAQNSSSKSNVVSNSGVNSVLLDEKMKKRAERFGMANA